MAGPRTAAADDPGRGHETHATLHPGFAAEIVATANQPVSIAFLPDGSWLLAEKRGHVYRVVDGVLQYPPLWNGELEVLDHLDCGLMSITIDPDFAANRYVYFLYVVDPDTNGVDASGLGFGRLTRYTIGAGDPNTLEPGSRTVLLGVDRSRGPLVGAGSHAVGDVQWGEDGTLLVSVGDGATAATGDAGGLYPDAFGPGRADPGEDIGAFRAQDPASLCGKILRLDPTTGHGVPSNPFWDGDPTSNASKVWQRGLRSPFRFAVRPGTGAASPDAGDPGTLYIGDVGWYLWEETNVASEPGLNFGWPCSEGPGESPEYRLKSPAHHGCETVTASQPPRMTWTRLDTTASWPVGMVGNCVIAGAFKPAAGNYPAELTGTYWFADYGRSWIRFATFNAADQVTGVHSFATFFPVTDFEFDPVSGDLYVVEVSADRVERIRYVGPDNRRPIAVASATIPSGPAPATVAFSSAGSHDPDGHPLTYLWTFGDGTSTSEPSPSHFYPGGGTHRAVLTVRDSLGWAHQDTVLVDLDGPDPMPATIVVDDFDRPDAAIGGAWIAGSPSLVVRDSMLAQNGSPSPWGVWTGSVFGADQEAFFTFHTIAPACRRYSLLLKMQGVEFASGGIEVRYDHVNAVVSIATGTAADGWRSAGTLAGITFAPGDRFGARAYADGRLDVFRNQARVGFVVLGNWPLNATGGRIGVNFAGATGARLDGFGGGTLFDAGDNTPPVVSVVSPAEDQFVGVGEVVALEAAAFDAQDPDTALRYRWRVDLHHNNHVHPFTTSESRASSFTVEDHDDGTGTRYEITLDVTDRGGATATAHRSVFLSNELRPASITWAPVPAGTADTITLGFVLHNSGSAPTPFVPWLVFLDGAPIASGEIRVPARDSVTVTTPVPPGLPAGIHLLRVVVDSVNVVFEPNEADNVTAREMLVVPGSGPDATAPTFVEGPTAEPFGVFANVRWRTDEPAYGVVRLESGAMDSVVTPLDTLHVARLEGLASSAWYHYRVTTRDPSGNARVAPPDSFRTLDVQVGVEPPPSRLAWSRPVPNPARGAVRFTLELPAASPVRWDVFDLQGRVVWSAREPVLAAGRHELRWPGTDRAGAPVASGVYVARLTVPGAVLHRRFAMIR